MIFNFSLFLLLMNMGFNCFSSQQELKIGQSQSEIPLWIKTGRFGINKATCGPVFRASIDEQSGKIIPVKAFTYVDILEGNIECLLAGYKNIV
jgi:hypothetical protein